MLEGAWGLHSRGREVADAFAPREGSLYAFSQLATRMALLPVKMATALTGAHCMPLLGLCVKLCVAKGRKRCEHGSSLGFRCWWPQHGAARLSSAQVQVSERLAYLANSMNTADFIQGESGPNSAKRTRDKQREHAFSTLRHTIKHSFLLCPPQAGAIARCFRCSFVLFPSSSDAAVQRVRWEL